jgi:hypothetical protein
MRTSQLSERSGVGRAALLVSCLFSVALLAGACTSGTVLTSGGGASSTTVGKSSTAHPTSDRVNSVKSAVCPRSRSNQPLRSGNNSLLGRPGLSRDLVPVGPVFLTACRYAGLNQALKAGTLENSITRSGAALAKFVALLDSPSLQVVKPGSVFGCPMSQGRSDLLLFVYRSGPGVAVSVSTDGCQMISNGVQTRWGSQVVSTLASWFPPQPSDVS